MIPITIPRLLHVMPRAAPVAAIFVGPINQALAKWGITSGHNVTRFLAQAAHESTELLRLEESLVYSDAERIARIFRTAFDVDKDKKISAEEIAVAKRYVRAPRALANRAYANRYGNGDEASGDGWRYRGRGIFQLTFKANYEAYMKASGVDVVKDPDKLLEPKYAADSAGWYWSSRGCNECKSFEEVTRRINPALEGLTWRVMYLRRAEGALSV